MVKIIKKVTKTVTKVQTPKWLQGKEKPITALLGVSGTLVAFAEDPIGFLREQLAPMVVGGVLDAFAPFIDGILFLLVGSSVGYPGIPPGPGVSYGLTDAAPLMVDIIVTPVLAGMRLGVTGLIDLNQMIVPSGAPFAALVVYALLVAETVILAEVGVRALRAVLDAVPAASGVETFIFGGS